MQSENQSVLYQMRTDIAQEQKRGIHIISASIVIWGLILIIHASPLSILQKNLYTFCCSAPLLPLAYLISKRLGIDFQNKSNPLTGLGLLFTLNQILYILIAMWIYAAVPDKMLMVYAMIFGASAPVRLALPLESLLRFLINRDGQRLPDRTVLSPHSRRRFHVRKRNCVFLLSDRRK